MHAVTVGDTLQTRILATEHAAADRLRSVQFPAAVSLSEQKTWNPLHEPCREVSASLFGSVVVFLPMAP